MDGKRILMPVATLLLSAAVFTTSTSSRSNPQIVWTPEKLEVSVLRGGSRTIGTKFVSNAVVESIDVFVTPGLSQFVKPEVSTIGPIGGGAEKELRLFISAPLEATEGVVEGTIHIKSGSRTISKPLPS